MRIPWSKPGEAVQHGLVLGLAVFAVGLLTRTRDVGGDDTVFAMAVDSWLRGQGDPAVFFATNHAIFNPLVAAVTWLVRLVHPQALALDVGAAVSSFFWGVAAGGLVPLLRRHGIAPGQALLSGAAVASCGGMWSIATRMEVYTVAAAAVVVWLHATASDRPRPVRVGAALAAAVTAHAALALLVVPTLWRLRRQPREGVRAAALGLGVPALLTLAVFALGRGVWTPAGWLDLLLPGESRGFLSPGSAWLVPRAFHALVLWDWYRTVPVLQPAAARVLDAAGIAALLLAAGLVVTGLVRTLRVGDGLGSLSVVAIAAFAPLWLVWDVGNPEHVVAATPLFGTLLALGAAGLPPRAGVAGLATLLALLVAVNGVGGAALQSRPENGRLWVTAGFVQEQVGPQAVILSVGVDSRVRLGLGYLSGRSVVDLTLAVRSARIAGRPATDGLDYWLERARRADELWTLDDVLDPLSEAWVVEAGIPRRAWRAAVAGLVPVRAVELEPDGAVVREPFRLHRVRLRGHSAFSSVSPSVARAHER